MGAEHEDSFLSEIAGRVTDAGEGRWTAIAAIEQGVPAPDLTAALFERFASREEDHFANQVLSPLRVHFGSHRETCVVSPNSVIAPMRRTNCGFDAPCVAQCEGEPFGRGQSMKKI